MIEPSHSYQEYHDQLTQAWANSNFGSLPTSKHLFVTFTAEMSSLGDKLVHLSLEIEDRTKSADLLQQLINDQSTRHESEVTNFEKEQDAFLQKITTESKESQTKISHITESLIQRKKTLENQVNELLAKKQDAEYTKKKNLDAVRRDITEAKESAYKEYKQERSQREKAWFDRRVSEIHKLTWKGSHRKDDIEKEVKSVRDKHSKELK